MNAGYSTFLIIMCLAATGCRVDPAIDSLIQENRRLEDMLYSAEDDYEQLEAELESSRRENSTLRNLPRDAPGSADTGSPVPGDLDITPPTIELPLPPSSDLPDPADKTDVPPDTDSADTAPPDERIVRIMLNSRLTGGYNFDEHPGDEGIMAVIEPRNAAGHYVHKAGPLSVVVLDPLQDPEAARVARWDFDSVETARLLQQTPLGRGIHLEMPWPNKPPEHSKLRLYVRYETLDGRKLEADREIVVDLPGQVAGRWMPASPESRMARRRREPTAVQNSVQTATPTADEPRKDSKQAGRSRPAWSPYR